ncbi:MAG: NAD(P)H-dependent oxidoreductase subunit E [Candidatus Tectomicrobia bacterium]|uniref:NAD(P)H-dependent oxidoreductase subunit E n=1 Tax=Tectimicrobiota bacterium TaxID=2528274 RepID=A0A933E8G4_UNCTE|nr:NAD(P)H-dependent oxidoreductase subunit E [Candidatus Tectomicrobia bacterium]
MALGARFPHSPREERFEFTPENRAELGRIMAKYPVKRSALIPALRLAQRQAGAVTSAVMQHVAAIFGLSPMDVWGVVSFYSMLKTRPVGKHHFMVCDNLSCTLLGAGGLLRHLEQRLGCRAGQTRADGKFSLERVECLGACGGAPCLQINEDYFERVTPAMADGIVAALEKGEPVAPAGADEAAPPRSAGLAQGREGAAAGAAQEKAAG